MPSGEEPWSLAEAPFVGSTMFGVSILTSVLDWAVACELDPSFLQSIGDNEGARALAPGLC